MNVIPLLSKPYVNEVTLREKKWPLKCYQHLCFFVCLSKRLRFFNPVNIKFVGQRAAKLSSVKLWERFDPGRSRTRADWFKSGWSQMADFFLRSQTFAANNFDALWPTDPIFTVSEDLNTLKRYIKYQKAKSIFRVIFSLSKWPHFTL